MLRNQRHVVVVEVVKMMRDGRCFKYEASEEAGILLESSRDEPMQSVRARGFDVLDNTYGFVSIFLGLGVDSQGLIQVLMSPNKVSLRP